MNSISSRFLGPKAENSALLADLVTTALGDYVAWRRRFHVDDPSPVVNGDLRLGKVPDAGDDIRTSFLRLLDRLHASVPFFSGRYNAHMLSEQTIAAQAAYFATMLYSPNNISSEVSPVTTLLEVEVAHQLAEMIGYDPHRAWGHLTSGGTIANFEALWVARNVLYHPVAAAGASRELGVDLRVSLADGSMARLSDLDLWQLLNLRPTSALDLWDSLWDSAPRGDVEAALRDKSLATLGYQDFSRQLAAEFRDPLPPGVVLTTATAHYSWEKIVRALGIGANQLILLPVDAHCRMDTRALWEQIVELTAQHIPIMACVAVCGSTEESAIDRLDEILTVRSLAERKLGVTFHLHADACYGGYAACVTRGANNERQNARQIRAALGGEWPTDEWVRAVSALEAVDSVSIDPHKLGYAPYPAGAFLLKDRRARELVAVDPPYLAPTPDERSDAEFLGRFIFEGSKPGASAAAVWLNHQTLPLNNTSHGKLIASTVDAAHRFHEQLGEVELSPFRAITLPAPDINIVCFLLAHPSLTSVEDINLLNELIYGELSASHGKADYFVSRTRLTSPAYDGAIKPILAELGRDAVAFWNRRGDKGIVMLRATIMNPFADAPRPDYMSGLVAAIYDAAGRCLTSVSAKSDASLAEA